MIISKSDILFLAKHFRDEFVDIVYVSLTLIILFIFLFKLFDVVVVGEVSDDSSELDAVISIDSERFSFYSWQLNLPVSLVDEIFFSNLLEVFLILLFSESLFPINDLVA